MSMAAPGGRRGESPSPSSLNHDADGPERSAKSKKPANTAFRQQRLRAWQPVLTPRTIIVVWSVLAVVLLAAGGVLYWVSSTVQDLSIEYTHCARTAPLSSTDFDGMPSNYITAHFKTADETSNYKPSTATWRREESNVSYGVDDSVTQTTCYLRFNVPVAISPPVVLLYRLRNFYQNHRRYVTSFNTDQLKGKAVSFEALNSSLCSQLAADPQVAGKPIYPCGLIANSIFNDTIGVPVLLTTTDSSSNESYYMTEKSINWPSDQSLYGRTRYDPGSVTPPPNWKKRYPDGYNSTNIFDPTADEHFQIWMRTAATADFSKPYMRNDTAAMIAGQYQIAIIDEFNVTAFNGQKFITLTSLSALGGRNPYIGIVFLVTGGFCLIMTILFAVGHLFRPRKMGDHTYLSWNNAPAATASGVDAAARSTSVRQR